MDGFFLQPTTAMHDNEYPPMPTPRGFPRFFPCVLRGSPALIMHYMELLSSIMLSLCTVDSSRGEGTNIIPDTVRVFFSCGAPCGVCLTRSA